MTQLASIETQVEGKEGGATAVPQKGENLLILHTLSADFITDLPEGHTPPTQQLPLTFGKIFIQDDHAEVNSTRYSSAWSTNACMANRTASAMASLDTLPLALYDCSNQQLTACAQEIAQKYAAFTPQVDLTESPLPARTQKRTKPKGNEPTFA